MNDDDIRALTETFPVLIAESRDLRATVEKSTAERHRELRQARIAVVVLLFLAGCLVALAVGNRALIGQTNRIAERVEDCATEGGKCLTESEARRGAAVERIVREVNAHTDSVIACALGRGPCPTPSPSERPHP